MQNFLGSVRFATVKLNIQKQPNSPLVWIVALVLAATGAAYFAARISPAEVSRKSYLVGQTATNEIVSPKKITVIDPVETEAKRQAELSKLPAMFRFKENAADEIVATFSADFVASRRSFLDAVEKTFKKRTLPTNQVAGPRFRDVFTTFKVEHKTFPATLGQALKWAQGNPQEELQIQFRERLRIAAGRYIRSDMLHPLARTGPVRFVNDDLKGSAKELFERSHALRRTNLVGLNKARSELATSFLQNERIVSDVLTNYLKVNCAFDEPLTQQIRAERTNSIWAFVAYEPGQVIVQRGQVIDGKIKAALDQLDVPLLTPKKPLWLWALSILCATLALLIGFRTFQRRKNTDLVMMNNVVTLPTNENADRTIQAQLMPHLARGLMSKLVRGLISQRSDLIQTQNAGSEQLHELEQRLEQINTRLQTRQSAYEQRIAELEKELAATEEENRELIRAKIREARQNLEWAKAQNQ